MSRAKVKKKVKPEQPKRSGRTPVVMFAVIMIVVAVLGWYVISQPGRAPGSIGDVAPDFELPEVNAEGLTDNMIQLSSFRGKVVVLEFMVSWCHVCQEMAPSIAYLNGEYHGQDVVIMSVAGTHQGATAESTAAFIREHGATWMHVLDTDNSVFSRYGVQGTPSYFIIDRSGRIVSKFQGYVATDAFSTAIDAALSG